MVYIVQTLYLHSGWLPLQLATCTGGLVPVAYALAHILHTQITTCTVMVVHGGGSGAMGWQHVVVVYNIIFGHVTL